ncbi:MAG: hypothetical protein JXA10_18640 [Anaerolineae bacterium]|nr:hypothetical protein [Anaerolineae bacterium]
MNHASSFKQAVWFLVGGCLVIIGVILSRHWHSTDLLHIHLSKNHGLETQDFIILIPTLLGTIWLLLKLWQNRQTIRMWIHQAPEKAILVALIFGILFGVLSGAVCGAAFATIVKSTIHLLHQLISP